MIQKRIPVLMYHQLDVSEHSSLMISPESFRRQVDWLEKKSFHFLSLDEVVEQGGESPLSDRSIALTFDDGFEDNWDRGFKLLIQRQKTAALFVVVEWVGQKGFLDWKKIRELSRCGITIGSHGLTHRWLPGLTDEEELRGEVCDSKKKIEDEMGAEVRHFCYPVGGTNERVADQVKKAGYLAGWVAGARPTVSIKDPLSCLRRIKVTPADSNLIHFAIKAYGLRGLRIGKCGGGATLY